MKEKTRIIVVLAIVFVIFAVSLEFSLFASNSKTGAATSCSPGWKCKNSNQFGYQFSNCNWDKITTCNYVCYEGECLAGCTDTDSGSADPTLVAGTVTGAAEGTEDLVPGQATDTCLDANRLTEYYCDFSRYRYGIGKSRIVPCPNGCANGACKQGCTNKCAEGARLCATKTAYTVCGDYNGDGCTEWSAATGCGTLMECWIGECRPSSLVPGGGSPIMASLKR